MKKRYMLCAALSISLLACNEQASSNEKVVGLNSPDTEKMAYLFGMQLSHQLFVKEKTKLILEILREFIIYKN